MKKLFFIIAAFLVLVASADAGEGRLENMLKTHLKDHYPWAEMQVDDLRSNMELPAGNPETIVVEQGPPGRTIFTLKYAGGKKIIASAMVKAFDSVVVTRRALGKATLLQKGDVYTTLVDTARIPKGAVRNEDDVVGKGLSRGVGANVVVTDIMVSNSPEVKKGQKVQLVVEAPGFTIRAAGELQQNAQVGNYVRVLNAVSHKVTTGLLLDERTVRVGL